MGAISAMRYRGLSGTMGGPPSRSSDSRALRRDSFRRKFSFARENEVPCLKTRLPSRSSLTIEASWLGGRDSNPDTVVQSHVSYRWTTSQYPVADATITANNDYNGRGRGQTTRGSSIMISRVGTAQFPAARSLCLD